MTAAVSTYEVTIAISDTIRRAFAHERNVAKRLAREAGSSERAAKNWLEQKNAMTLAQFFTLARRMPELKALGAELLGYAPGTSPEIERDLARLMQTVQRVQGVRNAAQLLGDPEQFRGVDAAPPSTAGGSPRRPGGDACEQGDRLDETARTVVGAPR